MATLMLFRHEFPAYKTYQKLIDSGGESSHPNVHLTQLMFLALNNFNTDLEVASPRRN